jgi:hypothetical protein
MTSADNARDRLGVWLHVAVRPSDSLRLRAARARGRHMHRRARLSRWLHRVQERATTGFAGHAVLLGVLVGLLFLPVGVSLGGPLRSPPGAKSFLSTLWQVDAAAIGLTLAFVIFALQMAAGACAAPTPLPGARSYRAPQATFRAAQSPRAETTRDGGQVARRGSAVAPGAAPSRAGPRGEPGLCGRGGVACSTRQGRRPAVGRSAAGRRRCTPRGDARRATPPRHRSFRAAGCGLAPER